MASRPSSTSSRPATGRAPTTRQPAGRGGRQAPRKPAPRKGSARSGGLPLPLRAVRGTWMGISHLAGGAVRRVGSSARDLEPEHRRDGIGFTLIGLAVVVAAREWWGVPGVAGDVIHAVVAGTLGRVGYALPLVLLLFGLRVLRAPEDAAVTNRLLVGTAALTFAACGLAHIVDGIPNPPDGAIPMRAAGGIIGFLASSPLATAVSTPGAVVILALLALFGLLVLTGTPLRHVPERLRELRDRLLHGNSGHGGEQPPADARRPRRHGRGREARRAPGAAPPTCSTRTASSPATRRSSRRRSSPPTARPPAGCGPANAAPTPPPPPSRRPTSARTPRVPPPSAPSPPSSPRRRPRCRPGWSSCR